VPHSEYSTPLQKASTHLQNKSQEAKTPSEGVKELRSAVTAVLINPSTITVSSNFHSLFRVLFNFPSRYLFTIGLSLIFSFRRKIPPALHCNIVQCDSRIHRSDFHQSSTGLSPSVKAHSRALLDEFQSASTYPKGTTRHTTGTYRFQP